MTRDEITPRRNKRDDTTRDEMTHDEMLGGKIARDEMTGDEMTRSRNSNKSCKLPIDFFLHKSPNLSRKSIIK
jgi:hypothetical protein